MSKYPMIGNLPVLCEEQFEAAWLRQCYVRYCQHVHQGNGRPDGTTSS